MSEILLSARGLKKTYVMSQRTLEVLRGVDVDIARGDFLALCGASGAGKSTLLHLIGGLDTPNAGQIHFAGQNLATFSENQLTEFRNRRVGFVFQAYHLLPELNALENVCLPARMARTPASRAEGRGRELLSRVGLQPSPPKTAPRSPVTVVEDVRGRVALRHLLYGLPGDRAVEETDIATHCAQVFGGQAGAANEGGRDGRSRTGEVDGSGLAVRRHDQTAAPGVGIGNDEVGWGFGCL